MQPTTPPNPIYCRDCPLAYFGHTYGKRNEATFWIACRALQYTRDEQKLFEINLDEARFTLAPAIIQQFLDAQEYDEPYWSSQVDQTTLLAILPSPFFGTDDRTDDSNPRYYTIPYLLGEQTCILEWAQALEHYFSQADAHNDAHAKMEKAVHEYHIELDKWREIQEVIDRRFGPDYQAEFERQCDEYDERR